MALDSGGFGHLVQAIVRFWADFAPLAAVKVALADPCHTPSYSAAMDTSYFEQVPFGLLKTVSGRLDGLSRGQTRRLIDRNILEPVHPNVLRVVASQRSPVQRAVAAAMYAEGAISHGCSLSARHTRSWRQFDEPHISVDSSHCFDIPGVTVHRRKGLDGHVEPWGPVLITSAALSIVDAGFDADDLRIRSAYHDLWHRGVLTPDDLQRVIDDLGASGRLGIPKARALLDRYPADGNPARSINEIRLYDAIFDAGLPLPRLNYKVMRPDGTPAFLDLAWPELRYCIEVDHSATHGEERRDYDLRRHGDVTTMGWFMDHFMEEHLDTSAAMFGTLATVQSRLHLFGRLAS